MNEQEQTVTPKYATLLYDVRKELDITWVEYVYLDMVYHLSHGGWCYKSLDSIADDMGMDRSNVFRMRNKLIERGLLIHRGGSKVKTSVIYAKRLQEVNPRSQNATKRSQNAYTGVVKTHTKNNNENNKELGILKNQDNRGIPSPAKERIRALLKQKATIGLN